MAQARAASKPKYDVHPGVTMMQNWVATLKEKTGRTLDEWIKLVKKAGPPEEKARRDWLKKEHGLGTNASWWIAERAGADRSGPWDDDPKGYLRDAARYVEEMYAAGKADLRPIHDAVIKLARKLGKDVKVCPCQTIVPFYREHVFAQIKPSTRTRLDLGFALAKCKEKLSKRLIDTGGAAKKDRITHRIPLGSVDEVDDEVAYWLSVVYDLDAP